MFGPGESEGIKPDIDVEQIFQGLEEDHYIGVLCEGCGMAAIGKAGGKLKVGYVNDNRWHDYEVKP